MADIFLIRSDNPEAIDQVCLRVRRKLQELTPEYTTFDRIDGTSWSLITGRNPFTPYVVSSDSLGAAVVVGSTYDPSGPKVSDLRSSSPACRSQAIRQYCYQLNFGVALSIENGEVLVTTDWLGLYPIYYFNADSTFIVTSIPSLLRCWSGFRPIVDFKGLVGILLLAHSCLGDTMFKGLTRLRQGSILKYDLSGRITREEVALNSSIVAPNNMDDAVEAFDTALGAVISQATPEVSQSVLLSGGLDSRIVAGYLHKYSGEERLAISLGNRKDLEMRAAARAASAIGAGHERISVDPADFFGIAQRTLDQDAMSSGLYSLNEWAFAKTPHRPILTGFHGDPIMGASHVGFGKEALSESHTYYAMFATVNAWGVSPGLVRELVRENDVDDIILHVCGQLRNEYYSYPGQPWQRSWWFDLHHRLRLLIGRLPKVIALRSWPILPYVHPAVIQIAFATPLNIFSDRKVQIELMLRKFPQLARLPFTGNVAHRWYRIMPSKRHPWIPMIDRVKSSLSWHWQNTITHSERRYFVRVFDFNGMGWQALRDRARGLADEADTWLKKDLVLELIPPSSKRMQFDLPISEPQGRRTLIGAVICCSQDFAGQSDVDSLSVTRPD
jgi:asparagine synthase (glutamine-hydrolysing)